MAIFTPTFKKDFLDSFINEVFDPNNNYYIFVAKHTPWNNEPNIDPETDNYGSVLDVFHNILFGKKITRDDYAFLIKKIQWISGTVYDAYDHREDLSNKNFYVVNSVNRVYKCLKNGNGAPSTVEPNSTDVKPFTLSDGYTWKYMFEIPSSMMTKFSTTTHIPVYRDYNIQIAAICGEINAITIDNPGSGYESVSGFIQSVVDNYTFKLEDTLSNSPDKYKDFSIYIKNGTGVGSLANVLQYIVNSNGKFIKTDTALTLDTTSEYLISPQVKITGNGTGAKAYSIVDNITGEIVDIVMLDYGKDYTQAYAEIVSTPFGSGAQITPILSPYSGHGSKPEEELLSDRIIFVVDFVGDEDSTIYTDVEFRQVGMLKNPTDTNGNKITTNTINFLHELNISSVVGTFQVNETIENIITGATAIIAKVEPTKLILSNVNGEFLQNNQIFGKTSGATAIVDSINSSDIKNGYILYYANIEKISRTSTSTETVSLEIKA